LLAAFRRDQEGRRTGGRGQELGVGVGVDGWMRTSHVRSAVAVLPVLSRSSEKIWGAVVPVTLTPFALRQLLKAASAELLIVRLKPPAKPFGAYLAHALNAAEFAPAKDAPGRGDPVGKARGEDDPVGRAPGVKDPVGRPRNSPGVILTPCCFRHVWKTLRDAVALGEALAADVLAALPPPQPARTNAPATAGSTMNRRSPVLPFMVISSKGVGG
jgi:hypothetical protein